MLYRACSVKMSLTIPRGFADDLEGLLLIQWEQGHSWETYSRFATIKIPHHLLNLKIHNRVHKESVAEHHSEPDVPNQHYFLITYVNTVFLHMPELSRVPFLQNQILYAFLISPIFYPSHPSCSDHSSNTWRREQIMKLLLMQFSPPSSLLCLYTSGNSFPPLATRRAENVMFVWRYSLL